MRFANELQKAIVDSINSMIADLCIQAGIQKENIYEIAVGANCTMMHTLLGVDATSIGKAPYAPIFTGAKDIRADEICSCAAGPALEGMNISSGMRAAEGAIEDVKITENGIELKVIGDQGPIGVCGQLYCCVRRLHLHFWEQIRPNLLM